MKRYFLLSLLIFLLIFVGLAAFSGAVLVLAIPLIIYLGAGLLFQPEATQLNVVRHLTATYVDAYEPVVVKVTILNTGPSLEEVYIEDLVPESLTLIEGEPGRLTSLPAGRQIQLTYTLIGPRGSYQFTGLRISASDRLGIFTKEKVVPARGRLLVLPEVIKLRRIVIRPTQTRVYSGLIPTRQGGPGVEFFGVREYQPGDPLRWINGRASARHLNQLFINEFQQERMVDVGLILDAREQSNVYAPEGSLFEYAVQATAALAGEFLNASNRVGLFIYGDTLDWTYPGYGKIQRQRILWALARAAPSASEVFAKLEHLPTRLFPARSQLVFISALQPGDAEVLVKLRARGYQLLVVSPNPILFERKSLGVGMDIEMATRIAHLERALLLGKLQQAGIQVLDWPVETPFQQAVHLAMSRVQSWNYPL